MNNLDLSEEIIRLQSLIQELLPFMINDVNQALIMGPPPEGHNDDCLDCVWYRESLALKARLDAGEFNINFIV